MNAPETTRPLTVCVDTNVWRSSLLLRTSLGPSLIHAIRVAGGSLLLPAIIHEEIKKQLPKAAAEALEAAKKNTAALQAILGQYPAVREVSGDDVLAAVEARLVQIGALLLRVPITEAHLRRALERVLAELPPNGYKNQQYKDSLIWEAILEIGLAHDVHLITEDTGFFEDKGRTSISPALAKECEQTGISVRVHSSIKDCLAVLQKEAPKLNEKELAAATDAVVRAEIEQDANKRGLRLLQLSDFAIAPYITEIPDRLELAFDLHYNADDTASIGRSDATVTAKGTCQYSLQTKDAMAPELETLEFEWTNRDGQRERSRSVYVRGVSVATGGGALGVPFQTRQSLSE